MRRFLFGLASFILIFAVFMPVAQVQAYVCSYNSGDKNLCEPFERDLTLQTAEERCTTLCSITSPACTRSQVRDACDYGTSGVHTIDLRSPVSFGNSPEQLIGRVIKQVVGILGALTFLIFSYGGFKWLTSAGNEEKVAEGTQAMLWAVVGLFVVFSSYILVNVILTSIGR
jgi:hypothetical protein